jgi:osmotically-inducible protein OsmY
MQPSEELVKKSLAKEPFPPTHSTLDEPEERASLDDERLADREVGSSLTDQEIAGDAIFSLARDARVDLGDGIFDRISVKSEGHVATITGVVDSAAARMAAEELVEAIPGVEVVQSAVTVAIDAYLDDEELGKMVREKLDSTGFAWVGSKVSHGIVRLVGTAEKLSDVERAVRTAAGIKGIRDVVSNIKVKMPEHTDAIDLLSLVTQNLAIEDVVVLDREVSVVDGIVHISGKVPSLKDRRRIRRIIADIAGVRGIRDKLQVDHALFRDWQARTRLSTGR